MRHHTVFQINLQMAKMNLCFLLCILISLKVISCAVQRNFDQSGSRKRSVSDPVSNFFSELGDLFLDIDGTIAVQTAPKVQREDRLAARLFEPLQPQRAYFNRVQENYRTFQDRLGSLIADTISASGAVRRANKFNEALLPDNSGENLQSVQKNDLNAQHGIKSSENSRKQVTDAEEQMRRSMERLISSTRKTSQFLGTVGSQALDDVSSVLIRRGGDLPVTPDNSAPQGRIIGDDLYSESRFDQYIRQLLRDHGKWVLDNPLFQRWRAPARKTRTDNEMEVPVEESSKEPEKFVSSSTFVATIDSGSTETHESSTKSLNELPLPEENLLKKRSKLDRMSGSYYRVDDSGEVIEEEIDIVLEPETGRIIGVEETEALTTGDYGDETVIEIEDEIDEPEEQDTVILAFTPDGVPLKLRMGPEIRNPVKYLHRVLRSAGVSLKVPVESYEDLEPVGKEVLLLGAGSGIITRAVYINVSNSNELNSLLRTLVKSKVPGN